jgi:hypothetical protein
MISRKVRVWDLDGLVVEFYLGFFELIKWDILGVVQESQASGKMLGSFNRNFLALIPKKQETKSFEDFSPISCCNLIYKLILTNIIAK